MNITLDKCGHTIIKKCHDENPSCTFKCVDRLDCGHACERNCHKNDDADHVEVKNGLFLKCTTYYLKNLVSIIFKRFKLFMIVK